MKRLNELIGIIQGINYDNVINDLEVNMLNNWLERNRSLRYNREFSEIIRKLDEILLDNYISDSEKVILIELAKACMTQNQSTNDSLNILNGIIEGIVCDNVINEEEVKNLHYWLEDNQHLNNISTYRTIYKIVKNILEDNIVTKDEQEELLALLGSSIIDSKTNMRIDYLKKLVANRNNIGIALIELIDDETVHQKIHNQAQKELSKYLTSYYGASIDNELVFISLTLIGMLNYNGNFYAGVREIYKELYKRYSQQKVESLIRSIILRYFDSKKEDNSRIINGVLMNSIIPIHFLPDFYEFIFDIYRLNFNYTVNKHMYEEFSFIYKGLRRNLSEDDDYLEFKVTKKTYKLISSTKKLIASNDDLDTMIQLSINVMQYINQAYHSDKKIEISNPYYREGYEGWINKYYGGNYNVFVDGQGRNALRAKWKPTFELHGKDIMLIPPIHRIHDHYDYRSINVCVYANDKLINIEKQPFIKEVFGGYEIKADPVYIPNPLDRISYRVNAGGEEIYNSQEYLYRIAIVFDDSGKELKNHRNYHGRIMCCYRGDVSHLNPITKNSFYILGYADVNEDTILLFDNYIFSFSAVMKPGINGNERKDTYLTLDHSFNVPVFASIDYLVFESDVPADSLLVRVNGIDWSLSALKHKCVSRNLYLNYTVELPHFGTGIYHVEILNRITKKRVKNCSFYGAIDKEFRVGLVQLNDINYSASVSSGFFEESIICDINIHRFDDFDLSFNYEGYSVSYNIPFDIPMYKIDSLNWKALNEPIWMDDIKSESIIQFYGIDLIDNEIRTISPTKLLDTTVVKKEEGKFKIPIGFLRSHKISNPVVSLAWVNRKKNLDGVQFYSQNVVNRRETTCYYDYSLKSLIIKVSFIGKNMLDLKVYDENSTRVFEKYSLKNNQVLSVSNVQPSNTYRIEVYEKPKGFTIKPKCIFSLEKTIYTLKNFIGKFVKISYVNLEKYSYGSFEKVKQGLVETYLRIKYSIDENHFKGYLYRKDAITYHPLYVLNPVEIEVLGFVSDNSIEVVLTKDGDGVLYDEKNMSILNRISHPTAEDVLSCEIELKEVDF